MPTTEYLVGRGQPHFAVRDSSGVPGVFTAMGDISQISLTGASQNFQVIENITGNGGVAVDINTSNALNLRIDLRNFHPIPLSLAMFGTTEAVNSGTVAVAEPGFTVVVGDVIYTLKRGAITSLVVKDSAGSPATLVSGTDYVHNGFGRIEIKNIGSYVMPIKVFSYAYAAFTRVPILTTSPPQRYIRLDMVNITKRNTDGSFVSRMVDLYLVQLRLAEGVNLVQANEIGILPITGAVLQDPFKVPNPATQLVSQYGEWVFN